MLLVVRGSGKPSKVQPRGYPDFQFKYQKLGIPSFVSKVRQAEIPFASIFHGRLKKVECKVIILHAGAKL
jgi:hypothetical protein